MKRRDLLPFATDDPNVALVDEQTQDHSAAGFKPLASAHGLETISNGLGVLLAESVGGDPVYLGDHAIPSMLSYQNYLCGIVRDNVRGHSALLAWRGVLGLVGLSQVYHFKIAFEAVTADEKKNNFRHHVLEELKQEGLVKDGILRLLTMSGQPVAFVHPRLGLCPFKNVEAKVMRNVPWYDTASGCWLDIAQCLPKTYGLNESALLALWLSKICQENSMVAHAADAFILDLGGAPEEMPGYSLEPCGIDQRVLPDDFPFVKECFFTIPVLPAELPSQLFLNKLTAVEAKSKDETLGSNNFELTFRVESGDFEGSVFTALLPFTQALTAALLQSEALTLVKARVSASWDDPEAVVTVEVDLRCHGFQLIRAHQYKLEEIVFVYKMPLIMLWPNVRLESADTHESCWNRYYVAEYNAEKDFHMAKDSSMREVHSPHTETNVWNVHQYEELPRFLHFVQDGETYCGCLYIELHTKTLSAHKELKIGIDFGTTNTLCMMDEGTGHPENLLVPGSYVSVLSFHHQSVSESKDITLIKRFSKLYWVPMEDKRGKIASVVQMFREPARNPQPLFDGCIIFMEPSVLLDNILGAGSGVSASEKTLIQRGIYSNMKLQDLGRKNLQLTKAGQVFIKSLLLYLLFTARLSGARAVEVIISYPREDILRNIYDYWEDAIKFIGGLSAFPPEYPPKFHYMTEAAAASNFFQAGPPSVRANSHAGYAIVDIGGGTTDVSLWGAEEIGKAGESIEQISIKYAGREIAVRSLYNEFSKGEGGFKALWKKSLKSDGLIKQYIALTKNGPANKTLQFEDTSSSILTILLEMLIDQNGFDEDALFEMHGSDFTKLKTVIRCKVFLLFYEIVNYIVCVSRKLKEMPQKEGKKLEFKGQFNIYLAGSGSKIIDFYKRTPHGSGADRFAAILTQMIKEQDPQSPIEQIKIHMPSENTFKTEVAVGLTLAAPDQYQSYESIVAAAKGKQKDFKVESCSLDETRKQEARDAYQRLVTGDLFRSIAEGDDDSCEKPLWERLDLDSEEYGEQARKEYTNLLANVYEDVVLDLPESRMPLEMLKEIFAVRMADEMMNSLFYQPEKEG